MIRALAKLAPLLLLVSCGCSTGSIRQGIWELAFQAQLSETRQPVPIPKRLVKVLVGPDDSGEGEVAEISPLPETESEKAAAPERDPHAPPVELRPMYADIRRKNEDQYPSVSIHHSDPYWTWQMRGYVRHSEQIVGVYFGAKSRSETAVLEGRWSMRWLRDE